MTPELLDGVVAAGCVLGTLCSAVVALSSHADARRLRGHLGTSQSILEALRARVDDLERHGAYGVKPQPVRPAYMSQPRVRWVQGVGVSYHEPPPLPRPVWTSELREALERDQRAFDARRARVLRGSEFAVTLCEPAYHAPRKADPMRSSE